MAGNGIICKKEMRWFGYNIIILSATLVMSVAPRRFKSDFLVDAFGCVYHFLPI